MNIPPAHRVSAGLAVALVLTLLALGLTVTGHGLPTAAPLAPTPTPPIPSPTPAPMTATATPDVTSAPATATATPDATPTPLTPTPAPSPGAQAVADPVYSSYKVGAYYFSGWSHAPNNNITPLLTGPMHMAEPLNGWYDDSQQSVDASIDQAQDAGISFFAFDWYDIARSPYATDKTLNEGLDFYMSSRERYRLQFCLDFVDQAPFIPAAAEWPALVRTWIGYFQQPDYVRVAGKPLFIIFSPEHMREMFGDSAGVRQALDYLRAQARAAGLPGVTIAITATVAPNANPIRIQQLNSEGYDAATGYSYHSLGGEQYRVPVPYERLVEENVAMWDRVPSRVPIPYIPVITSGFDLRYSIREQQTAIIYEGRTPEKFACYAVQARHWIDTHPLQTTKEHIVMVYAWTEMGEGGAIIPSRQDGYDYVQALRQVFGGPGQAPSTPPYCNA